MADISSPNTINLYDAEDKAHIFELKTIKYELQSNGTALCTLNTPSNLNALTLAQQWEMFAILDHATRDDQVIIDVYMLRVFSLSHNVGICYFIMFRA